MRRSHRLAAIVLALCGWVACAPAGGLEARNPPQAAPDAPPSLARAEDSPGWITTRVWVGGCSAPDDLWKYRKGSSTVTCDPRGRTLASTSGKLVWNDYLQATDVDTVTLEGEGLESLRFELAWSTDDTFKPESSVEQSALRDSPGVRTEVRFELKGVPGWQGLVRRFRLTWSGEPPPASRIVAAWGKKRTTH